MAVCNFSIGVSRIKEGTDFINCQVWGKQAENLCNYMDKGSKIAIDGRLQTSTYERPEGTKGYKTEVIAQNIEFLNSKKKEETQEISRKTDISVYEDFGDIISTDSDFLD